MNVRPTHLSGVAPRPAVERRLDVTVTDAGIDRVARTPTQAAVRPAAAPVAPAEPTSTPDLGALLSTGEKEAIGERFAALPRQGVTGSGVYDVRGRTPTQAGPTSGGLLDVTG
jgi:hypothetical protein